MKRIWNMNMNVRIVDMEKNIEYNAEVYRSSCAE